MRLDFVELGKLSITKANMRDANKVPDVAVTVAVLTVLQPASHCRTLEKMSRRASRWDTRRDMFGNR